MDLGQELAGLADQVGFDLDAIGQIAAQAGLGDLAELIDDLRQVLPGIGALGMIEREAADQLGLEGVRHLAGFLDVLLQVLLERHVGVLGAVVDVEQLDLADRRADRGHVQAVFVFQVANGLNLAHAELHHVLDAFAGIDEAQAVVLQAQGGKGGELLHGRLLIGGFVGEAAQRDLRFFRHGRPSAKLARVCRQTAWGFGALRERELRARWPLSKRRADVARGSAANRDSQPHGVGKARPRLAILGGMSKPPAPDATSHQHHLLRAGMVGMGMIFDETYRPFFEGAARAAALSTATSASARCALAAVASRTGSRAEAYRQAAGGRHRRIGRAFASPAAIEQLLATASISSASPRPTIATSRPPRPRSRPASTC